MCAVGRIGQDDNVIFGGIFKECKGAMRFMPVNEENLNAGMEMAHCLVELLDVFEPNFIVCVASF